MSIPDPQLPKKRGRKFLSRAPLPMRAKALGKTIQDISDDISKALKRTIPRTTIQSWYVARQSDSARPIPEDAVRFFEAEPWGIPRESWRNGISSAD